MTNEQKEGLHKKYLEVGQALQSIPADPDYEDSTVWHIEWYFNQALEYLTKTQPVLAAVRKILNASPYAPGIALDNDRIMVLADRHVQKIRRIIGRAFGLSHWKREERYEKIVYRATLANGFAVEVAGLPPSCRIVWTEETKTLRVPKILCGRNDDDEEKEAKD